MPDLSGDPIAVFQVEPGDVTDKSPTYQYVTATNITAGDDPFALTGNARYWLVFAPGSVETDAYLLNVNASILYARGTSLLTTDAGTNWVPGGGMAAFRLLFGGVSKETDITLTVEYTKSYL